jgi:hypothetical protein
MFIYNMIKKNKDNNIRLISFMCQKFKSDALMFRAFNSNLDKSELFRKIVRSDIEKHK